MNETNLNFIFFLLFTVVYNMIIILSIIFVVYSSCLTFSKYNVNAGKKEIHNYIYIQKSRFWFFHCIATTTKKNNKFMSFKLSFLFQSYRLHVNVILILMGIFLCVYSWFFFLLSVIIIIIIYVIKINCLSLCKN